LKFLELTNKRQSTRAYLDKPVEREILDRCLAAARLAPSACNSQPWKFIVVDKPQLKDKIARETFSKSISFNKFALQAPVLVVIVSQRSKLSACIGGILKGTNFKLMDIGIAAEHFCLQAAEDGIATCMMGWFNARKIGTLLNLPRNQKAKLLISVGYGCSDEIRVKTRKDTKEMSCYISN